MAETQDPNQPMAGRVVGGVGNVTESAIKQVESATAEAALRASQSGLARGIGYARAGQTILDGFLEGLLNIAQSGRQNITGDFAGDALDELEKLRAKTDEAIEKLRDQQRQ